MEGTMVRAWKSAFTLLELLIAIAAIAILLAILLPALGRARGSAWQVQCLNNLNQLGKAIHSYANDFGNHIPITSDFPAATFEISPTRGQGVLTPRYVPPKTHYCPDSHYKGRRLHDSPNGSPAWGTPSCYSSYLYRHTISPSYRVDSLAGKALLIDFQSKVLRMNAHAYVRCNILFADGRAAGRNNDGRFTTDMLPPDGQMVFQEADKE
jgi:prepilin-type N-terminal cleavage/methylation domain-containing protein/prepilin-type processing-associated H-X9-DG protein